MDNIYWYVLIRKQAKKYFENDFFKLMSNAVFRSVKNIDIKLLTTERRRNYSVSKAKKSILMSNS